MSGETKTNDDGGPAFPAEGGYASGLHPAPGMSLRDYFAAKALALLDMRGAGDEDVAVDAYAIADAMLAERAKRGGA